MVEQMDIFGDATAVVVSTRATKVRGAQPGQLGLFGDATPAPAAPAVKPAPVAPLAPAARDRAISRLNSRIYYLGQRAKHAAERLDQATAERVIAEMDQCITERDSLTA